MGTRLWPLSRALYPKQLQALTSEFSLLQETATRLSGGPFDAPMIICNQDHRFIVAQHLQQISIAPQSIVLEPMGRNTAPAAAAAHHVLQHSEPVLLEPANAYVRRRQHQIAERYNLSSESRGREPNRQVNIFSSRTGKSQ